MGRNSRILCCITIGMADTVAVIAGILLGLADRPRMKRLLLTAVQATFCITLMVSVLVCFWIFVGVRVYDAVSRYPFGLVWCRCCMDIGLRMIFHIDVEIRYTCILKLNNLWIRV